MQSSRDILPSLCSECPNFRGLKYRAKCEINRYDDTTELDFSIAALRGCQRGRRNDLDMPCTIDATPEELARFVIAKITGKTE
jgi:hypothetical protein